MRFGGVVVVAAGVTLMAGCGGGSEPDASTTTVTETETVTSSPTASATTEATSNEVNYGEPIEGEIVKFTVSDVRDVTDPQNQFDAGTRAAMIEICATGDLGGPIAPMEHFVLLDDSGSTYQPNGSTGGMLPSPQLDPGRLSVPAGECRRGNLFFDAPAEAKVTSVEAIDSDGMSMGTWGS